jgi:hypothetical protein
MDKCKASPKALLSRPTFPCFYHQLSAGETADIGKLTLWMTMAKYLPVAL